ncbi:MAG: dihydroorotase [Christensenellales bacterium]|jgi:dihydroorotase
MRRLFKNAMLYQNGGFSQLDIVTEDGRIASIAPHIDPQSADKVFDLTDKHIVPGLADVHVHLRQPGFSYKETIFTGTRAAARGGFTCVCSMPNLSPAPDTPEHLMAQAALIKQDAVIDVRPMATITMGGMGEGRLVDFGALKSMAVAFSDDGKGVQRQEQMLKAMLEVKETGRLIAAHCEDDLLVRGGIIHDGVYAREHHLPGISSESEWKPILRDIALVQETGCPYHVCHVSAKESVTLIRQAKSLGLDITCETAPHYLCFTDEMLEDDGRYKMNPPIRAYEDQQALVAAVADGTIDMLATDHAPHSAEEKTGGLRHSLNGIVGLETAFGAYYSRLVRTGLMDLPALIDCICIAPRKRFSLGGGVIREGVKADFCVLDTHKQWTVNPDDFLSMGKSTPFAGKTLWGDNIMTVYQDNILWQAQEVRELP